jgi:hypothetical protein
MISVILVLIPAVLKEKSNMLNLL